MTEAEVEQHSTLQDLHQLVTWFVSEDALETSERLCGKKLAVPKSMQNWGGTDKSGPRKHSLNIGMCSKQVRRTDV